MSPHITIHWIGHRKDGSKKGSVWGWFTEMSKPHEPKRFHYTLGVENPDPVCYVFWGRIGKTLYIEERELTDVFLLEVQSKSKNFKQQDPEKMVNRWGKIFDEELSMYIMTLRLRG